MFDRREDKCCCWNSSSTNHFFRNMFRRIVYHQCWSSNPERTDGWHRLTIYEGASVPPPLLCINLYAHLGQKGPSCSQTFKRNNSYHQSHTYVNTQLICHSQEQDWVYKLEQYHKKHIYIHTYVHTYLSLFIHTEYSEQNLLLYSLFCNHHNENHRSILQ